MAKYSQSYLKLSSVAEKALYVSEVANLSSLVSDDDYYGFDENDFYNMLTEITLEIQAEEDIRLKQDGNYWLTREDVRELAKEKITKHLKEDFK